MKWNCSPPLLNHKRWLSAWSALLVICLVAVSGQAWAASAFSLGDFSSGTVYTTAACGSTLFVGGAFTGKIAKVDMTTGARLPFAFVPDGDVKALAVDCSAQKLWVGGSFAAPRHNLALVDFDGTLIKPYFPQMSGAVSALVLSSTQLWAGGRFLKADGVERRGVAAFDRTTYALQPFNISVNGKMYPYTNPRSPNAVAEDSFTPTGETRAIALSPDEQSVYVAGNAWYNGVLYERRYQISDATPLSWLSPSSQGGYHEVWALAVQPNGTVAIGEGGNPGRVTVTAPDFTVLRQYTGNGNQQALAWNPDGSLWSGGHNQAGTDALGNPPGSFVGCTHLQRIVNPASPDATIDCAAYAARGGSGPWTLLSTSAGLVVGGDLSRLAGVSTAGLGVLLWP